MKDIYKLAIADVVKHPVFGFVSYQPGFNDFYDEERISIPHY